jgi:hypothetical protein
MKQLRASPLKITPTIVDALCGCGDVVSILEYVDALDGFTQVSQANGLAALQAARARLIEALPFVSGSRASPFEIISCDRVKLHCGRFNTVSIAICSKLFFEVPEKFDPRRWLEQTTQAEFIGMVHVCCQAKLLQRPGMAQTLTDALITHLRDPRSTETEPSAYGRLFRFTGNEYMFPVLQFAFHAMLRCGHEACALALVHAMTPAIQSDSMPLSWIGSLIMKDFQFLTPRIRAPLRKIIGSLPDADTYCVNEPSDIKRIVASLMKTRFWVHQGPEILLREIQSESRYGGLMFMSSVLLSDWSSQTIVHEFLRPFIEFAYVVEKRERFCKQLAILVSRAPYEIAYAFFREIMMIPLHDFVVRSMRLFLVFCSLEIFQQICVSAGELLRQDDRKLSPFMLMMMPNFERMNADDELATKFMCGLLETVGSSTPIRLQENVIDAIGLMYVAFKLHKSRARIINAAKNFAPSLKSIIASSLDVEFDFSQAQTLHTKTMRSSSSLRFTSTGMSVY